METQMDKDKLDNISHISKCIKVYNAIEKFILENGKLENGVLNFDIETISSKECFCLVEELIHLVLEG